MIQVNIMNISKHPSSNRWYKSNNLNIFKKLLIFDNRFEINYSAYE